MIKREDLSDRRDNSLQGAGPPASRWGSSLLGVSSNIPVSDGLPKNTKAERSESGLAYYESARPLHTQPSLYEGYPFMSPSPTIQADTPSSSRIKGKPDLHHDRPSPGSTSRGSTSRNKEGVRLQTKKPNLTSLGEGTSPIRRSPISRPRVGIVSKHLLDKLEEVVRLYLEEEEGDYCVAVRADCQSESYRYEKKNEVEEYTGEFRIDFKFISST